MAEWEEASNELKRFRDSYWNHPLAFTIPATIDTSPGSLCSLYQLYIYISKLFPVQVFAKLCFCRIVMAAVEPRRISWRSMASWEPLASQNRLYRGGKGTSILDMSFRSLRATGENKMVFKVNNVWQYGKPFKSFMSHTYQQVTKLNSEVLTCSKRFYHLIISKSNKSKNFKLTS